MRRISCSPCCSRRRCSPLPPPRRICQGLGGRSARGGGGCGLRSVGLFDTPRHRLDGESAVARVVLTLSMTAGVTATPSWPMAVSPRRWSGRAYRPVGRGQCARAAVYKNALHQGPVTPELAVFADGTVLAAASWDGRISSWIFTANEPASSMPSGNGHRDIAYRADGAICSSIGSDLRLVTWPDRKSRAHSWGCPIRQMGLLFSRSGGWPDLRQMAHCVLSTATG